MSRQAMPAGAEAAKPLPTGWRWVQLGDAGEIVSGVTLGRKPNGEITHAVPYLRVANVKDSYLDLTDVSTIEATEAEINKLNLQKGDLLLTEGGDPDKLGRGTYWENQLPLCLHQNHIFRIRLPLDSFSPEFVSLQIGSPRGKAYFLSVANRTTGIATINQKVLKAFPIMVPPLPEQKRISAILSEELAAVNKAHAAAVGQLEAVKALSSAYPRDAFAEVQTNGGEYIKFGDLVVNFDGRRIPVKQCDRKKGTYPYYGASGIIDYIDSYIYEGEYLLVAEDGANLMLRSLPVAFKASGKFWVNNHAHVVQPKPGISIDYLIHFFSITNMSKYISGTAQPKLTQEDLNSIPVPIPKRNRQHRIALELNEKMVAVKNISASIENQIAAINSLPAALLRRAFSGEL